MNAQETVSLNKPEERYVLDFFSNKENHKYAKFNCADNTVLIAERLATFGIIFSRTAVKRAILELVNEGMTRADGKDDVDDAIDAANATEARQRQEAESVPLTANLCAEIAAMSPVDVARRYHDEFDFRILYSRAAQLWGFKIPDERA